MTEKELMGLHRYRGKLWLTENEVKFELAGISSNQIKGNFIVSIKIYHNTYSNKT